MADPLVFRCASCGTLNRVALGREGVPSCGRCHRSLDVGGTPQDVDLEGLLAAIASSPVTVLVDFWAPWCGPCRTVAPIVDRLARNRAGRLLVLEVDTDAHPAAGARFRIRGIPTFVVFVGGHEVRRQSGALPEALLAALVDGSPGVAPTA